MATVTPNISPATLLARFRGTVTAARLTYPERAAIDVTDSKGGEWHLATWWADYEPGDPAPLTGKTVVGADLDQEQGRLTIHFSDRTAFAISPVADEDEDAIEHWELFTPQGLNLSFGPRGRWHLGRSTDI